MATIRKRGDHWHVQVRRLGRQKTRTFMNRKDAETWARQIEVEADRHDLPADPKMLQSTTLGELVQRYLKSESPRKKGFEIEGMVLRAFMRHPICSRRLADLSCGDFVDYRDERLKAIKPMTLRRQLSPLHNMFETARNEWGFPLKENPLAKVRLDCPNDRRERRLKDGELQRIIDAANGIRNKLVLPIITFALQTGLRRSEILAATWADFDLPNRLLRIPRAKNGHSRSIPLALPTVALLQCCRSEGGAADSNRERIFPLSANAFRLSWERLVRRAGIEDLHFHDLRHEAISRFFEMGLTAPEVALISGHRDARMLFRYAHPQHRRVIEQMDKSGSLIIAD